MNYKGIQLDLDWTPDKDIPIDQLPSCAGIYAEIQREFGSGMRKTFGTGIVNPAIGRAQCTWELQVHHS